MKICPQCGQQQSDAFSQCQKCRYIFPPPAGYTPPQITAPTSSRAFLSGGPSVVSLLGAITAALVCGAALWWLNSSEGKPVLAGSYENDDHHFAMLVPNGWTTLTQDNYKELFEKFGNRFSKQLQDGLSQRRIVVGFMNILENEDFSPSMNVVVVQGDLPGLDEEQKQEAARTLSAEFARLLENYKLEQSEFTTVDEVTSPKFVSTGGMRIQTVAAQPIYRETLPGWRRTIGQTPAEWKDYQLRFVQIVVPGKKRAYVITCSSLESQYAEYRPLFENAVETFRVLERPGRFGPIVNGALQGGLISGLLYLLYYIVTTTLALTKRG